MTQINQTTIDGHSEVNAAMNIFILEIGERFT
jgi:hypothetical protein